MAGTIVSAFLIGMDSGIEVPERLVYMESWSGKRTSQDAIEVTVYKTMTSGHYD